MIDQAADVAPVVTIQVSSSIAWTVFVGAAAFMTTIVRMVWTIGRRLQRIEGAFSDLLRDRWRKTDHIRWCGDFERKNRDLGIEVPIPDNPETPRNPLEN